MIITDNVVELTTADEAMAYGSAGGARGINEKTPTPIILIFSDAEAAQAVVNHLTSVLNPQA